MAGARTDSRKNNAALSVFSAAVVRTLLTAKIKERDSRLWRRAPVNSPPGCSVCALLSCSRTPRAQTARYRSRLHPRIPLLFGKRERGAGCCLLPVSGGRRGIRTPGGFHLNGFQDRRDRPLRHPSVSAASKGSRFLLSEGAFSPVPRQRPITNYVLKRRSACKTPFSSGAPFSEPASKRRSQRCAPRKKSAKVPAPECVPMTFPT